ncbi:MAG: Maf-like protein [Crocinitomicaceae bacterium]
MTHKKLVLGSKSPRRQSLIGELGFPVEIRTDEIEEIYPEGLAPESVPEYLAKLKAQPLIPTLAENEILVTSDTIVLLDGAVIGKPKNREDSLQMLRSLSGNSHTVITGVNLVSTNKSHHFSTRTEVFFSELSDEEIEHYVDRHEPFDKAGSYGIQEWLGYIGVSKIEGCYYNVMGLPLHDLYRALKQFNS